MRLPVSRSTIRTALVGVFVLTAVACDSGGSSSSNAGRSTGTGNGDGADGQEGTDGQSGPGNSTDTNGSPDTGAASGTGQALTQAEIARRVFDPTVTVFAVHAFHETGAEPYTGRLGLTANDTWDITARSYEELFGAHTARTISTPSRLEQMQGFADQGVQNWLLGDLITLGDSLVPPLVAGSEANVSIIFVNGLYKGNADILGIHPTNSPFAFVFKDVVRNVGGDSTTQRYIEQATVVHEIGHVIGFVHNGVPMVNAHEDTEHPHHTTDRDGVMYWAVESPNGSLDFATDLVVGARLSLFGSPSLLDAQNYMPSD